MGFSTFYAWHLEKTFLFYRFMLGDG